MTQYLYDGSYPGFLTAIFCAYRTQEATLLRQEQTSGPSLFDSARVVTDERRADRVSRGMKRLGDNLSRVVYSAWLSALPQVDDAILATLRLGFTSGQNPLLMRYDPQVKRVADCAQKVGNEAHRFLQFVRFTDVSGVFIADVEPQYDILPLIGNHFHQRFGAQRILIRDLRRKRAVVSDEDGWYIAALLPEQCSPVLGNGAFEQMWQRYFAAIANKARLNPKLQQQFVPLRFREHLTEFQPVGGNSPVSDFPDSSAVGNSAPRPNASVGDERRPLSTPSSAAGLRALPEQPDVGFDPIDLQ